LDIASDLVQDQEVSEKVRHRWAHVTVDEYQDTDPSQQRLLDAIVGDGQDICVVGDPRQAIYSFKGADQSYLTGFARRYPHAKVFNLTRNYRSVPPVLDLANRLARGRDAKLLVATRSGGPQPKVTALDTEHGEASWVAGAAQRAIAAGTPASEIAVLYRFNATQARFEAAFAQAGIATVVAEDSTFFDRDEVRAVLVHFRRAAHAEPGANGLEVLVSVLARAGFDRDRPPSGLGAARARWESQQALLELVEASSGARSADARTLLAEINDLAARTHGPRTKGVTLATLHKAKGLEWDVVFLVGMTDGVIPSSYADNSQDLAEEERLLHVGVTRARHELHLTWAASNARGWTNRPSPFLDQVAVPPARHEQRQARAQAVGRKASAVGATVFSGAECPHCTAPLKGIAARRLGVCAHCVMSIPGKTGQRARALASVVNAAARNSGLATDQLVGPNAMLRLLDQCPGTADGVSATSGVRLCGQWAEAAAEVLKH